MTKRLFFSADHGMAITARTGTSMLPIQSRLEVGWGAFAKHPLGQRPLYE